MHVSSPRTATPDPSPPPTGRRRDRRGLGPHRAAATADVSRIPLSDGGPGFVDVLAANLRGEVRAVVTTDPLGREVPATLLLVDGEGGPTAYLESAQAAGLHLLAADERDPTRTTTLGVGTLLLAALDSGARRIVIGLGGSGTNDAGAGLLAALGVGPVDRLARGGLALTDVTEADLAGPRRGAETACAASTSSSRATSTPRCSVSRARAPSSVRRRAPRRRTPSASRTP